MSALNDFYENNKFEFTEDERNLYFKRIAIGNFFNIFDDKRHLLDVFGK